MESTAEHLKVNTNLFVGFTAEDLEVLAPAAVRHTLANGEVLCRAGEPGNSLYIITVGAIEVRRPVGEGEVALAHLDRIDITPPGLPFDGQKQATRCHRHKQEGNKQPSCTVHALSS